jgi:hypothetical protein
VARFPGFIGGSNSTQSRTADAERTVNLFVEPLQAQSVKSPAWLMPAPGFSRWAQTAADVHSRGGIVADGRGFCVIGAGFYEATAAGILTKLGTVVQDAFPAQLVYNGKTGGQVGICSGGNIYTFTLATNTFAGPHFGAATCRMLNYSDGFGLCFDANTGRTYLSALNDLTTWSAGTFFSRSKFPDPPLAMFVDTSGLIWTVGTDTFEVRYNADPSSTVPFQPLSGMYGRVGIAAPFAYNVSRYGITWLARNGPDGGNSIVLSKGSTPEDVSTYAVNDALKTYARALQMSDAEVLVYHDAGHTFANYSFPTANATWTLDLNTKLWSERGKWNPAAGRYDAWAPSVHLDVFGRHLVGDRTTGSLWDMDASYVTDVDATPIRRLRRTPGMTDEHKRHPIDRFGILMDTGVAGQAIDPVATLRVSEDGGYTFGNELQAGLGRVGQYGRPVFWDQLGAPADCVLEVVWSDNAPTRVVDAWLNNAEQAAA